METIKPVGEKKTKKKIKREENTTRHKIRNTERIKYIHNRTKRITDSKHYTIQYSSLCKCVYRIDMPK